MGRPEADKDQTKEERQRNGGAWWRAMKMLTRETEADTPETDKLRSAVESNEDADKEDRDRYRDRERHREMEEHGGEDVCCC